jgi:hypothetical protein
MTLILRIPKGDKLTKEEMDGNLTYLQGLSQDKLSTGSFTAFTSSYTTGSFTGSFRGDGSGLTGIPGATPIATGSFATTGSNSFVGTETITGALRITGSLNLRSQSYPTSGSLIRIDASRTSIFLRPSGSSTSGNIQLYDSEDSRSILIINASQTSIGSDATSTAYGNNNSQNYFRGNTQFFQNITSSANIQAVSFIGDGSRLTNLPGATPIETSSFATTGSNVFVGDQIITGSLNVDNGRFSVTSGSGFLTSSVSFTHNTIAADQGSSVFQVRHINNDYSENVALKLFADDFSAKIQCEKDGSTVDILQMGLNNRLFIPIDTKVGYVAGNSKLTVTGSLLVTGSAHIRGAQTISGSLLVTNKIESTGSLILKPDVNQARYLEVYNTAPTDTHITASGGQIFIGDDTTYVKVDNYSNFNRIDIVANSGIYVSGSTVITGSLLVSGSVRLTGGVTGSSFTGSFVGNGSGLTGIPGTSTVKVYRASIQDDGTFVTPTVLENTTGRTVTWTWNGDGYQASISGGSIPLTSLMIRGEQAFNGTYGELFTVSEYRSSNSPIVNVKAWTGTTFESSRISIGGTRSMLVEILIYN